MSIVINKTIIDTAPFGLHTVSWEDDPKAVPRVRDTHSSPRARPIRSIFWHTTRGIPVTQVRPGGKPSSRDESLARYMARTSRRTSWDYTVDSDGSVAVMNDPCLRYCWATHVVNPVSIGVELVQDEDGSLYEDEIAAAVLLGDILTAVLPLPHAVQRQTPVDLWGNPFPGRIVSCQAGNNGDRFFGMGGHRNVFVQNSKGRWESVRGKGDPDDAIFRAFVRAGYETFSVDAEGDDRVEHDERWKVRQRELGFSEKDVDGLPLTKTRRALMEAGRLHGMWVERPVDKLIPANLVPVKA